MVHDGMVSFEQARDGMLAVMAIVEDERDELVPVGVDPREAMYRVFNRLSEDPVFTDAIDKLTKRQHSPETVDEWRRPPEARRPMDLPAIWTDPPEDPDTIENVESRSIVDPTGEPCWVQVGCEVRLKGLRSSPELNGRTGIVKKWYPHRQRFEVNLVETDFWRLEDRETPPLAVKPENMDKIGDWGAGGLVERMDEMDAYSTLYSGDGFGVVAARERDADEQNNLLCERAYVTAMHQGHKTKRCHRCFDLLKPAEPTGRIECPCGGGRYCSHTCRRAAWNDPGDHCRMECARGGLLWTSLIPTEFVLATRALRKDLDEVKRNIKRTRRWQDLDWRGAWLALEESDDPDVMTRRARVFGFAMIAGGCAQLPAMATFKAALSVMANTFGVKKPDWPSRLYRDGVDDTSTELDKLEDWRAIFNMSESTVAMGLFLDASLINHSCDPNCFASFAGREIRIHNVREVREGEEFTISYGPIVGSDTPTGRGEALFRSHGFRCECGGCVYQRDQDFSDFGTMRRRASELDDEARRLVNGGDDDTETLRAAADAARESLEHLNLVYDFTWESDDPEPSLTLALEFVRYLAAASAAAGCWDGTGKLSDDLADQSREPFYTLTRYAGRDTSSTDGIVERACMFLCLLIKYHSPLGFGGLSPNPPVLVGR